MSSRATPLSLPIARFEALCSRANADGQLEREITALFDSYRAPLLRYLLSIGLTIEDAEEVTQEVFLALFQHLRKGKPQDNLPGWLFRVGHNLGLKRRARIAVDLGRHSSSREDFADRYPDPAPSIEQQLAGRQRQDRMHAVIQALGEPDQFCLLLRMEGLRYRQIAAVLNMSLGSVALSIQRSLARLRSAEERCA